MYTNVASFMLNFYSVYLLCMYTAKETLCDPTFSMSIIHYTFKTTAANGMCSFGLGNVGSYNSTFTEEDIAYQAFNNPAGQYNYTQLIDEAEMQTYIITELFNNSDVSPSMFNIFLPDERIPTTDFLTAPAPDGPIIITTTSVQSTTSLVAPTTVMSTIIKTSPTVHVVTPTITVMPTDSGAVVPTDSGAVVFSCSLIIMIGCSILAVLL